MGWQMSAFWLTVIEFQQGNMDNCTIDCIQIAGNFSRQATCNFVEHSCQQSALQFIQGYYCLINQSFILLLIIATIVLALIYISLNSLTNHYLMPCVEEFIDRLRLSQGLAGVTFLAFANGAPDVITAIVAGSSSSSSTALIPFGSLYGAALFDMAFVLAMVIQFSPTKTLSLNKKEALVPLGFYIFGSVYLISVSFFYGRMNAIIAGIFLALYPIFICVNVYEERKIRQKKMTSLLDSLGTHGVEDSMKVLEGQQQEQTFREQMEEVQREIEEEEEQSESREGFRGKVSHIVRIAFKFLFDYSIPPATKEEWSPLRTVVSLLLSPFVSMLSFGFMDSIEQTLASLPLAVWFSFPPLLLLFHSLYCIFTRKVPIGSVILYAGYSFILVVCWITVVCSALINLLELLQMLTNMNTVFLGLTVLAWANCIGDYLSITAFARKGNASTAIAGIFSGPLFTFLLGFGVSCLTQSFDGEYPFTIFSLSGDVYTEISNSIVIGVIVMAIAYMLWIFVRIFRSSGVLGEGEQKIAKLSYIGFLLVALGLSILTDFYRDVQCDLQL